MTIARAPDRPWEPDRTRTCIRGRVLLKTLTGEAPEAIPHYQDRHTPPPTRLDGGPIDAAIRRFSPAMQVTCAFRPAQTYGAAPQALRGWDAAEEAAGLSRTFRIDVDPDTSLLGLVDTLRSLAQVETVTPSYLCATPFADAPISGVPSSPVDRLYAHRLVGSAQALAFEPGDSALIVGVVDSGIDLTHPEFSVSHRVRPGVDTVDLPAEQVSRGIHLAHLIHDAPCQELADIA